MSKIPEAARPAVRAIVKLSVDKKKSPEAKADAKVLKTRLRSLKKSNKTWWIILTLLLAGSVAAAEKFGAENSSKGKIVKPSKALATFSNQAGKTFSSASESYGPWLAKAANQAKAYGATMVHGPENAQGKRIGFSARVASGKSRLHTYAMSHVPKWST